MGNIVSYDNYSDGPDNYIKMSNGLTSVFLHTLLLSGSRLAVTDHQRLLMVYLGTQNQTYRGIGTVGFDVTDMPWNIESLEQDKEFMLNSVLKAKEHLGWETLDYSCNEEFLIPCLNRFSRFIAALNAADIRPELCKEWLEDADINDPVRRNYPRCEKHAVYLSVFGCLLCTD